MTSSSSSSASSAPRGVPGAGGARPPRRNALGLLALVLGLFAVPGALAAIPGIVLGVPAAVLGFLGRRRAARGEATNPGQALAGLVMGSIAASLGVAIVIAGLLFYVNNRAEIDQLDACRATAGQDADALAACAETFEEQTGQPPA